MYQYWYSTLARVYRNVVGMDVTSAHICQRRAFCVDSLKKNRLVVCGLLREPHFSSDRDEYRAPYWYIRCTQYVIVHVHIAED